MILINIALDLYFTSVGPCNLQHGKSVTVVTASLVFVVSIIGLWNKVEDIDLHCHCITLLCPAIIRYLLYTCSLVIV